jgi:S-adenosylmethionine:tRNA ribosyltransferase-isomerase
MSPASMPPSLRDHVRLMVVDAARGTIGDHEFADLASTLRPGDLLIVNDAATLPASFVGSIAGVPIELRLLGLAELEDDRRWSAVLFGGGDWRDDTNLRPAPPKLELGATIELAADLRARVLGLDPSSDRLIEIEFDRTGPALYAALYAAGHPIQYSHLEQPLELWSVQTVFASRPWAVEMPSAGRPLTAELLVELRRHGIELAHLTHAAGLSATGDPELDARLPMPERYEIPAETVVALDRARARGGRVIAAGTTVVRALEGAAAADGIVRAGVGMTDLVIHPSHKLAIVDALLTGMHDPSESHYRLLGAFADPALLERAWSAACEAGYHSHEFGDSALLFSDRSRPSTSPSPGSEARGPSRVRPLPEVLDPREQVR